MHRISPKHPLSTRHAASHSNRGRGTTYVAIFGSPVAQPAFPESAPRDQESSCNVLSTWSGLSDSSQCVPYARSQQRERAAPLFFFREQSSSQPTHTRTNNKNNSSVPIHLAAGKVTSAGGRVGIRERHSPRAAPTTIRRSSELGRDAMRRRHWCSKKLGGVGRLSDGLAAEKPGVVVSPGGGAVAWLLCAHTALNN